MIPCGNECEVCDRGREKVKENMKSKENERETLAEARETRRAKQPRTLTVTVLMYSWRLDLVCIHFTAPML